ncbi:MAG: diguanylate cyclase, partial [Acidobacteriota bacterium]|nr:diguanylate cyclase [Acidobacteriota bacterium]
LRDSRNILWVGTADGLNYFEPDMTTPRRNLLKDKEEETGINGHIWSLMEDSRGDIWIGTARGPAIWQRETGRFMSRRNSMPPEMDPSETYIRAMTEDVGGHIWLGAPGGLVRLDKDGGSRFFNGGPGEVLPHPFIGVLLKGRGDRLWIGSMGGSLAAVATDDIEAGFTVWSADKGPDGPVHPKISSLHQQADGTLWVGTYGGGLSRFDINTGRFRHFTLRDGMPNLVIYGILEDMRGDLWLSSNAGITRFDTETGPVRTYNHADGLPSNEFNMGASFADESGLLFFGSVAGMVSFLPGRFLQNEYRPPLVLAGLRKNTQVFLTETPIWRTETLDLGPEDRSFTVDYAALNFIQPSKNRYAVKLEGFDTDFQYVGGQRSATYTNLDPGRYVFHLKAANNDGYWSDPKELLQVTVPSPWFRSGTAYVLYAALFLLAAFYVALTQRSLAINNRELERRIADRTIELDLRNAELAEKNSELAHAYEELKMASLSDPLTGLGNRRFLFQSIEKEISALNRLYRKAGENLVTPPSDAFLGIFMISLDFFMELSDRHSYQNDDQILIQFSRLLEKVCRDSDWLVRWGGAEFLILTRRTEVAGLAKMAERLHEEIGNHTFQLADGDEMILHCSVGFTCYPFSAVVPRALSWEPTLQIADLAMHAARQSGSDTWIGLYAADGDPGDWVEQLFSDPYPLIAEKQVILETSLPEISELIWPKPAVIK